MNNTIDCIIFKLLLQCAKKNVHYFQTRYYKFQSSLTKLQTSLKITHLHTNTRIKCENNYITRQQRVGPRSFNRYQTFWNEKSIFSKFNLKKQSVVAPQLYLYYMLCRIHNVTKYNWLIFKIKRQWSLYEFDYFNLVNLRETPFIYIHVYKGKMRA